MPAERVGEPRHQRRENDRGEVLRGIENRRCGAAFVGRKPACDDLGVGRKRRRFGRAHREAQHEQRGDGGAALPSRPIELCSSVKSDHRKMLAA